MKAWFNKKGNWCFEFESSEQEAIRMSLLVSEGWRFWRENRKECPQAFLSATLLKRALGIIFIGQNYSQSHPTIKKPIVVTAEQEIKDLIKYYDGKPWNPEGLTAEEMQMLKDIKDIKAIL